jgi:hypothetical protein
MSFRIVGWAALFAVAGAAAVRGDPLPVTVDLGPEFQKFGLAALQQGDRGDCSLFAVTALAEFELAKSAPGDVTRLSEEFLIWAAHAASATEANDQAMFCQALHGLNAEGICASRLMPYVNTPNSRRKPSKEALADAKPRSERWRIHWIKRWNAGTGLAGGELTEIKHALAQGHPVACGLRWPKKGEGHEILRVLPAHEVEDGHSIVFTGYQDDARKPGGGAFLFRNSFGPQWGNHGYGVMSHAYAAAYANDAVWMKLGRPHSERPRVRFEAESLPIAAHGQTDCSRQEMNEWGRGMWSRGEQLFCAARNGGFVTLRFKIDLPGKYRVRVLATAAPDYGKIRIVLDGRAVPGEFDLYCGRVSPSGSLELGNHELASGPHEIRFAAAGKNRASQGHAFGVDAIDLLDE